MFEYRAKLREVVDGDTIDVTVDIGFNLRKNIRLRIKGIDTAEIHGVEHNSDEYELGMEHKGYVMQWVKQASRNYDDEWPLIVQTEKKGKYGRYLATVTRASDGETLSDSLRAEFDNIEY